MKKVLIGILIVVVLALIAVGIILGRNYLLVKKYANIEEYEIRNEKIPSVAKIVGTGTLKKASYTKDKTNDYDTLMLTYEDSNAKESTDKYLDYLKENDNYIDAIDPESKNENMRKIAETMGDNTITVEAELTEKGYILTIQVGKGYIKLNDESLNNAE